MNLTDPRFKYLSSATHSTPEAFRDRQRARMQRAAAERSVPYPEHCRHQQQCAGLRDCPRDPVCIAMDSMTDDLYDDPALDAEREEQDYALALRTDARRRCPVCRVAGGYHEIGCPNIAFASTIPSTARPAGIAW